MTLGLFVFSMESLPFSEFTRKQEWRHAKSSRHQARDAAQYVGPGDDKVTIQGNFAPEVAGDYGSLNRLREMANTGNALPLVDGAGTVHGQFRIITIDERRQNIVIGGFARTIDFAIDLERAD